MPQRIQWSINAKVSGGPEFSISKVLDVQAYDLIEVEVPAIDGTDSKLSAEIQPGGVGMIKFLLISSDHYSKDISFTVNAGTQATKLDQPLLLAGAGAVGLLEI